MSTFEKLLEEFPDLALRVLRGGLVETTPTGGMTKRINQMEVQGTDSAYATAANIWDKYIRDNYGKRAAQKRDVCSFVTLFPFFERAFSSLAQSEDRRVFETPAMKALIDIRWLQGARNRFVCLLVIYLAYVVLASLSVVSASMLWGELEDETAVDGDNLWELLERGFYVRNLPVGTVALVLDGLLGLASLVFIGSEFVEASGNGLRAHLASMWNWLDAAVATSNLASSVLFFVAPRLSRSVQAVAIVLAWLGILGFLRGFRGMAALVRMIQAILLDMRYFMLVLLIVFCGFWLAFVALLPGSEELSGASSFVTVYRMVLGDWEAEAFESPLSLVLFVLFGFFVVVVMLNLLIALMGDTFDRVTESQGAEIMRQRASLILEIESRWWPAWGLVADGAAGKTKLSAGRIYVLEPRTEDASDAQEWDKGRVGSLKEHTSKRLHELELKLEAQNCEIKDILEAQESQMHAQELKLDTLEVKLDTILSAMAMPGKSRPADGKQEV